MHHDTQDEARIITDNRFSVVPHWVIFSGISDGALRLYSVLQAYADSRTGRAFPSRTTLANDMHKSVRSIDGYLKELTAVGAMKVTRRRKAGTKICYSNLYTVVTANPAVSEVPDTIEIAETPAQSAARGSAVDCAENYTHLTTPTQTSTRPSEMGSREHLTRPTSKEVAPPHDLPSQIGITPSQAQTLVDEAFAIYNTFPNHITYVTDDTWDAWQDLVDSIEEATGEDVIGDMCFNKDWDERLGVIVAKHRDTEGVRYGIARWVAQIVLYVRAYPFAA